MLPTRTGKKLGLVIDLDICVGCHACAVACKEWNAGGIAAPLTDENPYGDEPSGVWFNRVHSYESIPDQDRPLSADTPCSHGIADGALDSKPPITLHFPRSCLHCEDAACVTVCPTGASYKREADGIVLVDEDKCIGCKLCSWACPYGAREYSAVEGVMKKCTLCVDRIYNETLPEEERQPACVTACPTRARTFGDLADPESHVSKQVASRDGVALMQQLGYKPVNRYLPMRPRRAGNTSTFTQPSEPEEHLDRDQLPPLMRWVDRMLSR